MYSLVRILLLALSIAPAPAAASGAPVSIDAMGTLDVLKADWFASTCNPSPSVPYCSTSLTSGSPQLAISLSGTVDLAAGGGIAGEITVDSSQQIGGNPSLIDRYTFESASFSFSGILGGSITGFYDGRVRRNGSGPTVDIGTYEAAAGPAVVPFGGAVALSSDSTQLVFSFSPSEFRHFSSGSTAKVDIGYDAVIIDLGAPIPEPGTTLLLGLGLAMLSTGRRDWCG